MAPKAATKPPARGSGAPPPRKHPEGTKQGSACTGFEIRQWTEHTGEDPYAFWQKIQPHFKKVTWQLERSPENGLLHWQGRGQLWKRIRPGSSEATSIAQDMMGHHGWHFSATTAGEFESGLARYQGKCATRVAGPWSEKDPPKQKISDVTYIEKNLHTMPFISELRAILEGPIDPREIVWVYDRMGNSRKSAVLAYLDYHGLIETLPFVDNHKDLLQFAHGFANKRAYGINIARGCAPKDDKERKEFASFIAGLESLKDGFVYDIRHTPKKERMERPHEIVMANCLPIFDSATRDRWRILTITANMRFEDITQQVLHDHDMYMEQRRMDWDRKEAKRMLDNKRKWDTYAAKNPEAEEIFERLQKRRLDRAQKDAELQQVRERHFSNWETPIMQSLQSASASSDVYNQPKFVFEEQLHAPSGPIDLDSDSE